MTESYSLNLPVIKTAVIYGLLKIAPSIPIQIFIYLYLLTNIHITYVMETELIKYAYKHRDVKWIKCN